MENIDLKVKAMPLCLSFLQFSETNFYKNRQNSTRITHNSLKFLHVGPCILEEVVESKSQGFLGL